MSYAELSIPVNGNTNVIQLKNPQVIRMGNIDILFETQTNNTADLAVLVSVIRLWTPANYTTGHVARTTTGKACGYNSQQATHWDGYGILLKYSQDIEQADRLASLLEKHGAVSSIGSWVDYCDDANFDDTIKVIQDTAHHLVELSQRQVTLKSILGD